MAVPVYPMHDAQKRIKSGWIGFTRPYGYVSRLIASATASPYPHVFAFGRSGLYKEVSVFEVREWEGGAIVPLHEYKMIHPGPIDVFRIDPRFEVDFDGEGMIEEARDMIERTSYNWWQIIRMALRKTPFLWHFLPTSFDEGASIGNVHAHCSHAVDYWAHKGGGIKAVRNMASHFVTPGMLASSLLWEKVFTIE